MPSYMTILSRDNIEIDRDNDDVLLEPFGNRGVTLSDESSMEENSDCDSEDDKNEEKGIENNDNDEDYYDNEKLLEPFRPNRRRRPKLSSLFSSKMIRNNNNNCVRVDTKNNDSSSSLIYKNGDASTSTLDTTSLSLETSTTTNTVVSTSSSSKQQQEEDRYQTKLCSVVSDLDNFRKLKEDLRKNHRTGFAPHQSIYHHIVKQQASKRSSWNTLLNTADTNLVIQKAKSNKMMAILMKNSENDDSMSVSTTMTPTFVMTDEEKLFLQNSSNKNTDKNNTSNRSLRKLFQDVVSKKMKQDKNDNRNNHKKTNAREGGGRIKRPSLGTKSHSFVFRISRKSSIKKEEED